MVDIFNNDIYTFAFTYSFQFWNDIKSNTLKESQHIFCLLVFDILAQHKTKVSHILIYLIWNLFYKALLSWKLFEDILKGFSKDINGFHVNVIKIFEGEVNQADELCFKLFLWFFSSSLLNPIITQGHNLTSEIIHWGTQ